MFKALYDKICSIYEGLLQQKLLLVVLMSISFFSIYAIPEIESIFPVIIKYGIKMIVYLLLFIVYYYKIIKHNKINKLFVLFFIYWVYIVINTIIHKGYLLEIIYGDGLIAFASIIFIELILESNNRELYLKIMYYDLLLLSIMNFILLIYDGEIGIFNNSNTIFKYYIVLWITEYIVYNQYNTNNYKIFIFISFLISFFTSLLQIAYTTLICCVIWYFFLYIVPLPIKSYKVNKFLFNKFSFFSFFILFFIFIIWFGSNSPIIEILDKVFHLYKGISGRTEIYEITKESIMQNPVFGYGNIALENRLSMLGIISEPHNVVLQFMIHGGVIGLLFFVYLLYIELCAFDFEQDFSNRYFLYFALFIFLLRLNVDNTSYKYLMFAFAYLFNYCDTDFKNLRIK